MTQEKTLRLKTQGFSISIRYPQEYSRVMGEKWCKMGSSGRKWELSENVLYLVFGLLSNTHYVLPITAYADWPIHTRS